MIAGVPVQFLPAWNRLVEAAVTNAALFPYDGNDPNSVMREKVAAVIRIQQRQQSVVATKRAMGMVTRDAVVWQTKP